MKRFSLYSDYKPAGDQSTAIKLLNEGLTDGLAKQTLLGVTGSGKRFTIANIIEIIQNLITTVDSGQPFFSKWWCIGAILKTLFPVSLYEPT